MFHVDRKHREKKKTEGEQERKKIEEERTAQTATFRKEKKRKFT